MPKYSVGVLVHHFYQVAVEANNEEHAVEEARRLAEQLNPSASLVDVTDMYGKI